MTVNAAAVGILVLSPVAAASPQSNPLQAMPIWRTEVVDQYVVVTMRNTASDTITAWGVRGTITYEDASTERFGMDSDGALTGFRDLPQSAPRSFTPGTTLTVRIPSHFRKPVKSVALSATTVVFADGTAIGDEPTILRIFEDRRREHDAVEQVEKIVADALSQTGAPAGTLLALDKRLDDPAFQKIRESRAYGQIRQNVTLWLRLNTGDQEATAFRLRHTLRDARSRLALAKRHMHHRDGSVVQHVAGGSCTRHVARDRPHVST